MAGVTGGRLCSTSRRRGTASERFEKDELVRNGFERSEQRLHPDVLRYDLRNIRQNRSRRMLVALARHLGRFGKIILGRRVTGILADLGEIGKANDAHCQCAHEYPQEALVLARGRNHSF